MAKKTSKAASKSAATMLPMRVAHRIEALLHTMRVIERHEEQLCVLMTEIKNTGVVSGATQKELRGLLEELPADVYQSDLDAVSRALAASGGSAVGSKTGMSGRSSAGKTKQSAAKAGARTR